VASQQDRRAAEKDIPFRGNTYLVFRHPQTAA
jgi:hypothetical protein